MLEQVTRGDELVQSSIYSAYLGAIQAEAMKYVVCFELFVGSEVGQDGIGWSHGREHTWWHAGVERRRGYDKVRVTLLSNVADECGV